MEIESVIKNSQQQEQTNPAPDGFTNELYQTLNKKHLRNSLQSLSKNTSRKEYFLTHSMMPALF